MEDCSTGILVEIDTGDNNEIGTHTDTSIMLSGFEKDFVESIATATKRCKSNSINYPLEEKQNGRLFSSELFNSANHLLWTNNNISLAKKLSDNSSSYKSSEKQSEDRWTDIINCEGDSLLENEKFDFSISLSDDTSRTDDDVFCTRSEGSSEGRNKKIATKKQMKKHIGKKHIQRNNINENKENFEDHIQNSNNERTVYDNFIANSEEMAKENVENKIPRECSLVRQNTFTISTDNDSLSTSKSQDEKKNQSSVQDICKKFKSCNYAQPSKPLNTIFVSRNNTSIEKNIRIKHAEFSRSMPSKDTRLSTTKRSLKECDLQNSHDESQASKKSNLMSVSNLSSFNSCSSSSQSKIIGMNNRNGKFLNRSQRKKHEPLKATLPVNQITKSRLRPPTKCNVNAKSESKINQEGPDLSRVHRRSQVTTSSDSSLSFTPQRRYLNTSAIPALTSTPNRRNTSSSSMSSTPSLRPFLKTSGLPTPIRLLNSSDVKI